MALAKLLKYFIKHCYRDALNIYYFLPTTVLILDYMSIIRWIIPGGEKDETDDMTKSSSAESIHQSTPGGICTSAKTQPRTASIRQRPSSTSLKHSVLEELFQKQRESDTQSSLMSSSRFQSSNTSGSPSKGRVYASVAEMKRSKSKVSKIKDSLFTETWYLFH